MSDSTKIVDPAIHPYFIKVVNSAYEVHKEHKSRDGQEYTKFISSSTDMYGAMQKIASLKINAKNIKVMSLRNYLEEIRAFMRLVNDVVKDDKLNNKLDNILNRLEVLESKSK